MADARKMIYDVLLTDDLERQGIGFTTRDRAGTSKAFVIPGNKIDENFIRKAFRIDDPDFSEKFRQATTGSGGARKDFDAYKSSALCALLCFYGINNLRIDDVTYTRSFFEVKNKVFDKPSNMDVVLTGEDDQKKKVILFLECKFSEYLDNKIEHISGKYMEGEGKRYYEAIQNAGLGKYCTVDGETYCFYTERAYSQGTKQVISHLLGLKSFIDRDEEYCYQFYPKRHNEEKDRRSVYQGKYDRVIFRELLFRFGFPECDSKLNAYIDLSKDIKNAIIDIVPKEIEFEDPITYQEIFSPENNCDQINPNVAHFYSLIK